MSEQPIIWCLLGRKAGDNSQVRALAEALALPWEGKRIHARGWELLVHLWPRPTLAGISRASAAALVPPWPHLVISAGRRNEPVARWIQRRSGGRTKLVHIGRPWAHPRCYDLIVSTPQYFLGDGLGDSLGGGAAAPSDAGLARAHRSQPDTRDNIHNDAPNGTSPNITPNGTSPNITPNGTSPNIPPNGTSPNIPPNGTSPNITPNNILINSLPLNRLHSSDLAAAGDELRPQVQDLARPRIAVLVGGDSGKYVFTAAKGARLGRAAVALAQRRGGGLLVTDSPRTPRRVWDALCATLRAGDFRRRWNEDGINPYRGMLALADEIVVTGESMSMLGEAASTGKPVHIFDLGDGAWPWWALPHNYRHKPLSHRLAMALAPRRLRRDVSRMHRRLIAAGRARWLPETVPKTAPDTAPQAAPAGEEIISAQQELENTAAAVRRLLDWCEDVQGRAKQR